MAGQQRQEASFFFCFGWGLFWILLIIRNITKTGVAKRKLEIFSILLAVTVADGCCDTDRLFFFFFWERCSEIVLLCQCHLCDLYRNILISCLSVSITPSMFSRSSPAFPPSGGLRRAETFFSARILAENEEQMWLKTNKKGGWEYVVQMSLSCIFSGWSFRSPSPHVQRSDHNINKGSWNIKGVTCI